MNTRTLIASLSFAFAAAAPVMAQEASPDVPHISGQLSRAEVAAGARQAVQAGTQHELYQIRQNTMVSANSRGAVRAHTLAALHSGEVDRLDAEAPALGLTATHAASTAASRMSR